MIKVAIIGAGFCAKIHADAYKKIKNVKVVAIVDKLEGKAKKLAKEFNRLSACLGNDFSPHNFCP